MMAAFEQVQPEQDKGGQWVTIGSKQYKVAPLSFRDIRELQERISAMGNVAGAAPSASQMDVIIDVAHAALKRNYPALPKSDVEDMVDMGNYQAVFGAALSIAGFKPAAEGASGEAVASTGTSSTSP